MVLTDPIADMVVRIKNALRIKLDSVSMPASKVKAQIADVLKKEGYIRGYDVQDKGVKKVLRINLKYKDNMQNVMNGIKRVSSPGRHMFVKSDRIPKVQSGFGTAIITTSKGIMSDSMARKNKTGGEILLYVW